MLNLDKIGIPFAKIIGGKYNNEIVSVSEDLTADKSFKYLGISNDAKFQLIPNEKTEREILYITGPSGSGESTFVRKYLEQYKKVFKDREVYWFSSLPDDPSLDDIEPKRIRLDSSIYEDPLSIEEFANSVVIFDDVDVFQQTDQKCRLWLAESVPRDREALFNHLPDD